MMYVLVILLLAMGIAHLLCKFISRQVADIDIISINGSINETSDFLVFCSAIYSERSNIMEVLQNKTTDAYWSLNSINSTSNSSEEYVIQNTNHCTN